MLRLHTLLIGKLRYHTLLTLPPPSAYRPACACVDDGTAYCEDFPDALHPNVKLAPPTAAAKGSKAVAGALVDAALERAAAAAEGRQLSVALVTGGGTGIGRAVALKLAAGGWQRDGSNVAIVLTGRRTQPLEETAQEVREAHGGEVHTLVWPCDLSKEADVDGLFGAIGLAYGRLDL